MFCVNFACVGLRGSVGFVQEISLKHSIFGSVLLVAHALALAQVAATPQLAPQLAPQPHPTDASVAVSPVVYQSVFADTPTGVEVKTIDWKKANADVGQFSRGHVDILKWEDAQSRAPKAAQTTPQGTHVHGAKP